MARRNAWAPATPVPADATCRLVRPDLAVVYAADGSVWEAGELSDPRLLARWLEARGFGPGGERL